MNKDDYPNSKTSNLVHKGGAYRAEKAYTKPTKINKFITKVEFTCILIVIMTLCILGALIVHEEREMDTLIQSAVKEALENTRLECAEDVFSKEVKSTATWDDAVGMQDYKITHELKKYE